MSRRAKTRKSKSSSRKKQPHQRRSKKPSSKSKRSARGGAISAVSRTAQGEGHPRNSKATTLVDRSGKVHHVSPKGKTAPEKKSSRRSDTTDRATRPTRKGKPPRTIPSGKMERLKGVIDKNHKGFAFLIFDSREFEDSFIPARMAEELFHGDRVEVAFDPETGEVLDLEVLEHRFREVVGRFTPHPREDGGWVVYERKRAREEVYIPKVTQKVSAGDWIQARLQFENHGRFGVIGEITHVFGPELPASADIGMVAAEYNLVEEHSETAVREAEAFKLDLNDPARTDLRHVPFITIDGETARDFDDAVYVERDVNGGGYILWVAIADVSHYVRPGTALDDEARARATSVYFPERAFHMLPRALSENLCSLRPNEPRLAMTAKMHFSMDGRCTKTKLFDSIIESRRRATYNEIQKEFEENANREDWEFAPHFELYKILRKMRKKRGSLDFDLPEAEIRCTPEGEVLSITKAQRWDANRLIEEFMIAANEAVTQWIMKKNLPFIYRVHDEPAGEALERFQKLAATVGVSVSFSEENVAQTLTDLISRLEDHPAQTLLNFALLRSMRQAVYTATHGIHFGLASKGYTHFTSPIRRYPDLVVHRMLRRALQGDKDHAKKIRGAEHSSLEEELQATAEHCSYRERIAADAERESIRLKQVRLMLSHLGNEFESRIIGMSNSGLFVDLNDPYVEGMISFESIGDDFYQFDEEKMMVTGKRKRRIFRIGDRLKVRVVRADIDRRQVDFSLIQQLKSN